MKILKKLVNMILLIASGIATGIILLAILNNEFLNPIGVSFISSFLKNNIELVTILFKTSLITAGVFIIPAAILRGRRLLV